MSKCSYLMLWNLQLYNNSFEWKNMTSSGDKNILWPLLHIFRGSGPPNPQDLRPWARVRDSFSPETAFGLLYRPYDSSHTPILTWRPRISGRRSSYMERVIAQCHLRTIYLQSGDLKTFLFQRQLHGLLLSRGPEVLSHSTTNWVSLKFSKPSVDCS